MATAKHNLSRKAFIIALVSGAEIQLIAERLYGDNVTSHNDSSDWTLIHLYHRSGGNSDPYLNRITDWSLDLVTMHSFKKENVELE